MSNFDYSNINITNSANNLIYDYTIESGDKSKNKSFSTCQKPTFDKSSITQLLAGINSIVMLYNECKKLSSYCNRMYRSINNKLAKLDFKSFHKLYENLKEPTKTFVYHQDYSPPEPYIPYDNKDNYTCLHNRFERTEFVSHQSFGEGAYSSCYVQDYDAAHQLQNGMQYYTHNVHNTFENEFSFSNQFYGKKSLYDKKAKVTKSSHEDDEVDSYLCDKFGKNYNLDKIMYESKNYWEEIQNKVNYIKYYNNNN